MPFITFMVLAFQIALLSVFAFFSFFNYLYALASLRRPRLQTTQKCRNAKVAVVVVAFNERYVLAGTLAACDDLTYENKTLILADDSNDPELVALNLEYAKSRGCRLLDREDFPANWRADCDGVDIWEGPGFVYVHRQVNTGFKAGSLRNVDRYLQWREFEYMYLLDADWHPQVDAIERTLETIEAYDDVAFVQTKRVTRSEGLTLFQKHVSMHEEGCYFVDFEGRQVLDHPILFSGSCTLLDVSAVREVGGFGAGHLTEDLDLTNRLWLAGFKGKYRSDVINRGEVPYTYGDFRRQQERWSAGSARALRESFRALLRAPHLSLMHRLSALRQNAYFTSTLFTAAAILTGIGSVAWLILARGTYEVEYYLYVVSNIRVPLLLSIYTCLISNLIGPVIMAIKRRRPGDVLHLPMAVWYAWSILPTYVIGNIKGLLGLRMNWFRTPKFGRTSQAIRADTTARYRIGSVAICLGLMALYFFEGFSFGWKDEFALILIPAFALATLRTWSNV